MRHLLNLAGEEGFEPSLRDPESRVLPLDDSPAHRNYSIELCSEQEELVAKLPNSGKISARDVRG